MGNYLIVGGSSGIGLSIVQKLAADNHQVFATFKENSCLSSLNVKYQYYDALKDVELMELPEYLDGMAFCPGNIDLKPFNRFNEQDFIDDFQFQVIGAIKVIKQVLPLLKKAEQSSIVLFSTIAVDIGFPFHTLVSTSKGALEGLSKSLAAELAPKVRVNCIAPSLTNTPLASNLLNTEDKINMQSQKNPMKRVGAPEDIANIAQFLLSNQSSWLTGQIIHVDGGMSTLKI